MSDVRNKHCVMPVSKVVSMVMFVPIVFLLIFSLQLHWRTFDALSMCTHSLPPPKLLQLLLLKSCLCGERAFVCMDRQMKVRQRNGRKHEQPQIWRKETCSFETGQGGSRLRRGQRFGWHTSCSGAQTATRGARG